MTTFLRDSEGIIEELDITNTESFDFIHVMDLITPERNRFYKNGKVVLELTKEELHKELNHNCIFWSTIAWYYDNKLKGEHNV